MSSAKCFSSGERNSEVENGLKTKEKTASREKSRVVENRLNGHFSDNYKLLNELLYNINNLI